MSEADDRAELVRLLEALSNRRFGAQDWLRMFAAYDADSDGKLTRVELLKLLGDASVGNAFTRGMWANGIAERIDLDGDGIELEELSRVLVSSPPSSSSPSSSPMGHPDLPGFRRIRNPSVQRLNTAIVLLWASCRSDASTKLRESWDAFLQSDLARNAADSALYPAYKAFSVGYHYAWSQCPHDKRPSSTPEIGLVTLVAEDLIETAAELESTLAGVVARVEARAKKIAKKAASGVVLALVVIGALIVLDRIRTVRRLT